MLLTADFRSVGDDRDDEPEMHLNGAPGRFRLYWDAGEGKPEMHPKDRYGNLRTGP